MRVSGGSDHDREGFRSWGEAQIARCLNHHGIDYMYEHPLAVVDRGKVRVWYPDFQLAGYGVIVEYCGLADDPHYAKGMARKEAVYTANGLNALMLTPDMFRRNWPDEILGQVEGILNHRLAAFRESRYCHEQPVSVYNTQLC